MISHHSGTGIHPELDPKTYTSHSSKDRVSLFALDVSGSMLQWAKFILNKFPMFYGLIRMHDYLKDPSISFCAIGDINFDSAPLQVSQFQQGKDVEFGMRNLYNEGGQSSSYHESYEFAAYFYNHFAQLKNYEMAFFFVVGDESYEEHPDPKLYEKFLGTTVESVVDPKEEWKRLMGTYNVFHVKKTYGKSEENKAIDQQWVKTLGEERVLRIPTEKACLEVILGAISLTSGARSLEGYLQDMEDRAQTEERIAEVRASLQNYASALARGDIKPIMGKPECLLTNQ